MKSTLLSLIMFALLVGCAGVNSRRGEPLRELSLTKVEKLFSGPVSKDDAASSLGKPDRVVKLKRDLMGKVGWIYEEKAGSEVRERLGLMVDEATGRVESATWRVHAGDEVSDESQALKFFGSAGFRRATAGAVAKDYVSDEVILSNPERGITLELNPRNGALRMVTLVARHVPSVAKR